MSAPGQVPSKADGCLLGACRVCTGCAHDRHDTCRGTVRCPTDGRTRPCTCCGPTYDCGHPRGRLPFCTPCGHARTVANLPATLADLQADDA